MNEEHEVNDEQGNCDDYFGVCPTCGHTDGYLNIGSSHWFLCETHRYKWHIGSNLFSDWKDETEEQQRAILDRIDFGSFREIPVSEATTRTHSRDEAHAAGRICRVKKAFNGI